MSRVCQQSTKESFRDDIETSRKQKTVYKNYEYYDDYSYSQSTKLGFYLEKDDETYLYFFQENGPKDIETLRKFLEWRRSGNSNEIGHKGGGNKRNINGFYCEEAFICMKIDDKNVIRCATKPNSLYELAISPDIDEETFRSDSDSSTYITNPEKMKIKNLPGWYSSIFEKIEKESNISPNFLIRLELTEIPEEYTSKEYWDEYLNQVRAKQYTVPIYFKNELLSMEKYEKYDNIDLVGIDDIDKISEMNLSLYINKDTKDFYFKSGNKYINVKNEVLEDIHPDMIEWGIINMFIVSKDYFTKQLKEFNTNNKNTMRAEDFYGIYLYLNDKLTNYLPFGNKLLGDSRNNGISVEDGQKNNGRFRMILKPNEKTCEDSDIFDSLIHTREIKALTDFLEKSPYKKIKDISIKFYKGESITKSSEPIKKKKIVKKQKIKEGGVYIVYLGNGLWKFGMVTDHNNKSSRITDHSSTRVSKIEEYIENLSNKEIPKGNKCIEVYYKKTPTPKGDEERICSILLEKQSNKIKLFKCERSSNEAREYFVCDDFDYIHDTICDIL